MLPADLAPRTDLTIVSPVLTPEEVRIAVTRAIHEGYGFVTVTPIYTARVAAMLHGTATRLCTAVAFPFGQAKPTLKAIEATSTLKDGAHEIAIVPDLANLLCGDVASARAELIEIVRAARSTRRDATVRVVIQTPILLKSSDAPELLARAAQAARESGCDVIQTATATPDVGVTTSPDVVRTLKQYADTLLIEAVAAEAEQIRTLLDAGADRVALRRA